MPQGIYINYNDGRPPMTITAGLRAPSYCTFFDQRCQSDQTLTINTPLSPGSELILVPTRPIQVIDVIDNQVIVPTAFYINSVTRNGNSGVIIRGANQWGYTGFTPQWAGYIMEILPASTYNTGIYVANSTDFTAISSNAKLMTCQYAGRVTVNGSLSLPVSGIPFAKWSSDGVSVGFDGTNITVRSLSYTGMDDVAGSVTMDLVIFNNTPPIAGNGITMVNRYGQVTFSTMKKPFIYDRSITLSASNQSIGDKYIQLGYYGMRNRYVSGYDNIRYNGIYMYNGNVRAERNRVYGNYNVGSLRPPERNVILPIPALILPNMY